MAGNYVCLMRFLDQSESFVNGWECGMIWVKMTAGEKFNEPIHLANMEQIALMADYHGYHAKFTAIDETWICFTAEPVDISPITL